MTVNASGDQVVLTSGDLRLTVVTVGGGMRELTCGAWAVLQGYGMDEVAPGASGQPLIPWPNRIAGGRYEFRGRQHQLPITEPDLGNALHGLVRWMTWRVERAGRSEARLSVLLYPRSGYPFALHLEVEYAVHPSAVDVITTARNVGRTALPYANGFHPYLSVGVASIDECRLEVPAGTWLRTDARKIPIARETVAGTTYDFRSPREISDLKLDTCFTDLGDAPRVTLRAGDDSRSVAVRMDETYRYLVVYTGDDLDPSRRRKGLAVEPMTAAPNAFQSGDGLLVLEPGESFTSRWGIDIG